MKKKLAVIWVIIAFGALLFTIGDSAFRLYNIRKDRSAESGTLFTTLCDRLETEENLEDYILNEFTENPRLITLSLTRNQQGTDYYRISSDDSITIHKVDVLNRTVPAVNSLYEIYLSESIEVQNYTGAGALYSLLPRTDLFSELKKIFIWLLVMIILTGILILIFPYLPGENEKSTPLNKPPKKNASRPPHSNSKEPFDLDDLDTPDMDSPQNTKPGKKEDFLNDLDEFDSEEEPSTDLDTSLENLDDLDDFDLPDLEDTTDSESDLSTSFDELDDFELPADDGISVEEPAPDDAEAFELDDFELPTDDEISVEEPAPDDAEAFELDDDELLEDLDDQVDPVLDSGDFDSVNTDEEEDFLAELNQIDTELNEDHLFPQQKLNETLEEKLSKNDVTLAFLQIENQEDISTVDDYFHQHPLWTDVARYRFGEDGIGLLLDDTTLTSALERIHLVMEALDEEIRIRAGLSCSNGRNVRMEDLKKEAATGAHRAGNRLAYGFQADPEKYQTFRNNLPTP